MRLRTEDRAPLMRGLKLASLELRRAEPRGTEDRAPLMRGLKLVCAVRFRAGPRRTEDRAPLMRGLKPKARACAGSSGFVLRIVPR